MTRRTFTPELYTRNRYGKLVSAKASRSAKISSTSNEGFQRWRKALQQASKETGIKISPQTLHSGSPLHLAARAIYDRRK